MISRFKLIAAAALAIYAAPGLTQTPNSPAPAAAAVPPPPRPALKVKPKFLSGDDAEFPAEAKALGHHGTVIVGFKIDSSGAVVSSYVKRSSGSPILDESALATSKTARFSPAMDTTGTAIPLEFQAPYDFYQSKSDEHGGGFVHYRCSALTAEMDWWESTHPDNDGKGQKDEIYHFLLGFRVMTSPRGMMEGLRDGKVIKAHDADWDNVRKKCRKNPDALVVDFLEKRALLLELAKQEAARTKR